MKKLKFSALSVSLKSFVMFAMILFAAQSASAWVGEQTAVNIAVTQINLAKNAIDPSNPDATLVAKVAVWNNIINNLNAGIPTADSFYSGLVFKTASTSVTTATAVDATNVDTKAVSKEIYDLLQ